ncbi:MAG: DUF1016 family protein [Lewinellaceae bacterium]|nr:DUF1016 family protein [Lewinellaceae bacterium]
MPISCKLETFSHFKFLLRCVSPSPPRDHADAGQMNLYLNYYRENEMTAGDALPVGVILCAQKNRALVHYATGGLPQQIFVSKYLLNLPSEEELRQIVQEEQDKLR